MGTPEYAMGSAEGAAARVQLDGMISALEPFESLARTAQDSPVLRLLLDLRAAHGTAQIIEGRQPSAPLYKGVQLSRN